MTPTARRMASELGSACCCAEADRLLNVVAGVNFGAKRVERTTRLVGDDLERWRTEWLSGSITVVGGDGEAWNDASFDGAPVRRPLREGRIPCVGLDGTGIPALPSETAGRKGKDGRTTTREAKVGAVWVVEPDGEGGMRPAPGSTRHFAAVESAEDDAKGDSPVARRLLRELAAPTPCSGCAAPASAAGSTTAGNTATGRPRETLANTYPKFVAHPVPVANGGAGTGPAKTRKAKVATFPTPPSGATGRRALRRYEGSHSGLGKGLS